MIKFWNISCTDGSQLTMFPLMFFVFFIFFFTLPWCKSNIHSVETFKFWILIFPQASNMQYDILVMLGSGRHLLFPVSHTITRVNNWYPIQCTVSNIFLILYVLCFWIPSCLQNARLCLLLPVRRGRQLLMRWNSI